ncbi:MAG: hypothetical protein PVF74_12300 [Anaerolineales bacterium]|jgi:hypothetical protein
MEDKSTLQPYLVQKMMVAITVILFIAAVHIFRVGSYFSGKLFIWYYSFFSDIVIPIGIYFMLCVNDVTIHYLNSWKTKAAIVFVIAAATEIAQAFGIPILGSTFDPLDFVMFGVGIFIAIGLDYLFSRVFSFWSFGDEKVPTGV